MSNADLDVAAYGPRERMLATLRTLPREKYGRLRHSQERSGTPYEEYLAAFRRANIYLTNINPKWKVDLAAEVSKAIWQDDTEDTIGVYWETQEAAQKAALYAIAAVEARLALTRQEFNHLMSPWDNAFWNGDDES